MNRIYRLVWCQSRGTVVVASELAHSRRPAGGDAARPSPRLGCALALALLGGLSVYAGPSRAADDAKLGDLKSLIDKYDPSKAAPSSEAVARVLASQVAAGRQATVAARAVAASSPVRVAAALPLKIDRSVLPSTAFAAAQGSVTERRSPTWDAGSQSARGIAPDSTEVADRRRDYASRATSAGLTASGISADMPQRAAGMAPATLAPAAQGGGEVAAHPRDAAAATVVSPTTSRSPAGAGQAIGPASTAMNATAATAGSGSGLASQRALATAAPNGLLADIGNGLGMLVDGTYNTLASVVEPVTSTVAGVTQQLPLPQAASGVNGVLEGVGGTVTGAVAGLGSTAGTLLSPTVSALQDNLVRPAAVDPATGKLPRATEPNVGLVIGTGGLTGNVGQLVDSTGQSLLSTSGYVSNGNLHLSSANVQKVYTAADLLGISVLNLSPVGTLVTDVNGLGASTGSNAHLTLLGGVTSDSYITNINVGDPGGILGTGLLGSAPAWASQCVNALGVVTAHCWGVNAAQDYQVLVGDGATANGSKEVVIGTGASHTLPSVDASVAFPGNGTNDPTNPTGVPTADYAARLGHSVVIGDSASGTANGQTLLGAGATSNQANSVALGYQSSALRGAQTNYVAYGLTQTRSSAGEVSVGSAGGARQITNVAAGSAATDAVNVEQLQGAISQVDVSDALFAVKYADNGSGAPDYTRVLLGDGTTPTRVSNLQAGTLGAASSDAINGAQLFGANQNVATYLGGSATVDASGNVTAPTYTLTSIGSNGQTSQGDYHDVGSAFDAVGTSLGNVANQLGTVDRLAVKYTADGNGAATNQVTLVGDGSGNAVGLGNLADGALSATSRDAVTGAQLFGANQNVASYLGGNASLDANGRVLAPSYAISSIDAGGHVTLGSYNDVGSALLALNSSTVNNNQQIQGLDKLSVKYVADLNGEPTNQISLVGDGSGQAVGIANVAPGQVSAGSLDAINGGQLHGATVAVAGYLGGGASVDLNGALTAPTYTINAINAGGQVSQGSYHDVGSAFDAVSSSLANVVGQAAGTDRLAVKYSADVGGNAINQVVLTGDGSGAPVSLQNVAEGAIEQGGTQAINGGQLFATHAMLASFFGGSTAFNPLTGTWQAPTFSIGSIDSNGVTTRNNYGNVTDAFAAVDGSLSNINTRINNITTGQFSNPYYSANSGEADANATGENAIAAGPSTTANGDGSFAGGYASTANGVNSSAIGTRASAVGDGSLAVGAGAQAMSDQAVAIGNAAAAGGGMAVSVGSGNLAMGNGAVAVGDPNVATGTGALAIGADNTATGDGAVALGNLNVANGQGAVALGNTSNALAAGAVALGNQAQANNAGDVALGSGAVTAAAVPVSSFAVGGTTYSGLAGTAPTSVVSVGAAGAERQITNVAAGRVSSASTDAINGSQLFAVASNVNALAGNAVQYDDGSKSLITLGGGAGTTVDNVAAGAESTGSSQAVNGGQLWHWTQDTGYQYSNQSLYNMIQNVSVGTTQYLAVNSVQAPPQAAGGESIALGPLASAAGASSVAIGNGASAAADNSVALGAGASTDTGAQASYTGAYMAAGSSSSVGEVSVGSSGNNRTVSHVADGVDAHDAANVGQLQAGVGYAIDQSKAYTDQQITNISNGTTGMFQVNNTAGRANPSAAGDNAVAGGAGASASAANATALGSGAQAQASNSVALGADSVADRADSVSVGSAGAERQVTHVAAGTASTDAVNLGQLQAAQAGTVRYDTTSGGATNFGSITLGQTGTPAVVHNVAAGSADTDAVNVGQLTQAMNWANDYTDQRFSQINRDIDKVGNRASAGVASAMAAAGLPQAYEPGKSMAAIAAGSFRGESSLALGVSVISEGGRWVYKLAGSTNTRGDAGMSVGAGFTW